VTATPDLSLEAALGPPIKGPSAFGSDPRRFARLTWTLAVTQFRLKFYGSALGYVWQLARPLALFGVLYVVFTEFVRFGTRGPHYEVGLLMGIVLFTFFSEATSGAVGAVVEREVLVRKVEFPRLVIPCAVVLTALFNLGLNLAAVVIFAAISGVQPHASLVEVPLILGVFVIFVMGLAMLLSALYVRYRDVQPIWDVVLQMLFYGTPIFYTIETVQQKHAEVAHWMILNPFAAVVQQMRHACIDPGADSAAQAAGGWGRLGLTGLVVVGLFALGLWVFHRAAPRIAEEL
jgi:ABC-2 type transport system permease protein